MDANRRLNAVASAMVRKQYRTVFSGRSLQDLWRYFRAGSPKRTAR